MLYRKYLIFHSEHLNWPVFLSLYPHQRNWACISSYYFFFFPPFSQWLPKLNFYWTYLNGNWTWHNCKSDNLSNSLPVNVEAAFLLNATNAIYYWTHTFGIVVDLNRNLLILCLNFCYVTCDSRRNKSW